MMEPWQVLLLAGVVGIGCQWIGFRNGYAFGYRVAKRMAALEGVDMVKPFTLAWGAANWWEDRARLAEQKYTILSNEVKKSCPGTPAAAIAIELDKRIILPPKQVKA
jgi:hypothetical protein